MAKQVNKKFLTILTLAVVIAIGGGFFGLKWIRNHSHQSPTELLKAGDDLMGKHQPDLAAAKFGQAAVLAPTNPLPISRLGDALYELSKTEPEYGPKAMAQWNSALQMDPNFTPAMKSKLDAYIEDMEAYQRVKNFNDVREVASRIAKLEPTYTRAVSYQYIATLSAWMNNQQTDPAAIKEAMDGLRSLAKADPADATMPYQIARGLIQMGQDEMKGQNTQSVAMAHYAEAGKTMDDAVASQPGNVGMLLRAGQIYAILQVLAPQGPSKSAFDAQAGVYLDRARALVREDDKNYEEVETVYASRKLQRGEHIEAEKVYRSLLVKRPDDVPVRLVLAEILQADRRTRKEAADLLAKTVEDGEKPTASRTAIARTLQLRAILRLASVRMDLLEDVNNPTDYKAAIKEIEADIAKAESKMAESSETLKVRGRLQLIEGDVQAAVTTLSKAVTMLDSVSRQRDYELVYSLARAQLAAQQNDDAKRLLRQVVQAFPQYTPARSLLVDVLLNSNEMAEAAANIDELDKQLPGSPTVARFRILTLDSTQDAKEVDRLYMLLPQDSKMQMLEKARVAIVINRLDDAIKLMEAARGLDSKDIRVADRLARLYLYKGDRARAKEILDQALVIAPKDPELLILRARVDNATPNELIDLTESIIKGNADPLSRLLQLADLERLRGNAQGLYKDLTDAEKIAPNDSRVQEQLFTYYIATKQWDTAAKYIDPLTKSNYGGSQGLLYRWKFAVAKNDYDTAVSVGREFTQKMPEFATSWISLGQALKLSGQYEEALRCFKTALDHQGSNRDAIRGSIDCLYALNRPTEAKTIIATARRYYPSDLTLAEMELEWDLKYGDPKNAMAPLLGRLTNEPGNILHYLNAAQMYFRMSTQPGSAADQAAYLQKGIEILSAATKRFPDEIQPYINLAELQSISKDRVAAEATLKSMCDQPKLKDRPEPRIVLAEFYIKGGQADQAEKPLRDAVAVAPKSMEIRRKLAVYLAAQGRVDDAIATIDAAPDKQAIDPVLMTARLEILVQAGRYADAESAAQMALQTQPNTADWFAIMANAQYNQNKFDASITSAEKALSIDSKNNRALITRAMAKLNRPGGDVSDAIKDLESYRDLNPTDNNVRRLLADAYMRSHRPEDATRELEIGLHNSPTDRQVRITLLDYYRASEPPRWSEGDQIVKDADAIDVLVKDPEWLAYESSWFVSRKQFPAAVEKIRSAMFYAPKEDKYQQTFLSVLLSTKNEQMLMRETESMIAANPNRWWVYQARGIARKTLGDAAGAEQEFRRAFAIALAAKDIDAVETIAGTTGREVGADKAIQLLEPHARESTRLLLATATQYLKKGDQATCLKYVNDSVAGVGTATPDDQARILRFAGAVYSAVSPQQTDNALKVYTKLVTLQPDNVDALNQLAWLMAVDLKPPQIPDALKYAGHAYNLLSARNQFSPTVFDTYGWVLILSDKSEQGVSILRKVVDQSPAIDACYHLGVGYAKLGKKNEAMAQFNTSKELMDSAAARKEPVDATLRTELDAAIANLMSPNP